MTFKERLQLFYRLEFPTGADSDSRKTEILDCYPELSREEMRLLAWLYGHQNEIYDWEEVRTAIGSSKREADHTIAKLLSKGLLVKKDEILDVNTQAIERFGQEETASTPITNEVIFSSIISNSRTTLFEENSTCHNIEVLIEKAPTLTFSKGYTSLKRQYGLDPIECSAFFVLAGRFLDRGLSPLPADGRMKKQFDSLIEKGLAMATVEESEFDDNERKVMISPSACHELFFGMTELLSSAVMASYADIWPPKAIKKKDLYFNDEDGKTISMLQELFSKERYSQVLDRLRSKKRRTGICCLFYGGPGTGKTELVRQIARMSDRDVFNVDVSKIFASKWGESEKNLKAAFLEYRYLTAIRPTTPVFLLNEADSLLKDRRQGRNEGVDRAENILQTIILQEMESFEGILIATTNLVESLDDAIFRRFLFKCEFSAPTQKVRAKIMRSLMPELSGEDIESLTMKYNLSGGQIANVAERREIYEIIHGVAPELNKLSLYCEEELVGESKKGKGRKIGF